MKKYLLLILCLVSSLMASAESGTCGDDLTWELSNGVLTISGAGWMTNYSYSSSSRAPWYSSRSTISRAIISDGVKSIGKLAFYDCSSLTSITIPNSVTSIGALAFYYCSCLTSITIPNSVTDIGSDAFKNCPIAELYIDNDKFCNNTTFGDKLQKLVIGNSVRSIDRRAFYECHKLSSISIPNSLRSIGDYAFEGCPITELYIDNQKFCNNTTFGDKLQKLVIGNSVTSIGVGAFEGCSDLTSITIPNSVTSIDTDAFRGCSGLTSLTIPNSVTSIGGSAFASCSRLTSITIPNSVTSIRNSTFYGCSGLTSVSIPNSAAFIGDNAFYNCNSLTSVSIPNSVTSIGNSAFYGCSGLTSVTIGNSVKSIGNSAFYGCNGLTSVSIGNSVTSIGGYAFEKCSGLTSVTIPNSVSSIGSSAFSGCKGLTSVSIGNSVTSIGDYAFYECSGLTSVTIPNSVTSIGDRAFNYCSRLTSISVLATTPPTCGSDLLSQAGTNTIHVYEGLADVYKAASGWSSYNFVDDISAVRVTSLTLDASRYLCRIGQRFTPQVVSYEPENATIKQVTWSSSDPSILTIGPSTGVCIGLKDGIVTITATAKDADRATTTATVYVGNVYPEDAVTISVSSSNETMGTVSGGGTFLPGATVTLTATPARGFKFQSWSDGSTENPYTFEANENKELVADFVQKPRHYIKHVKSGLFLKFDPSVTETNSDNVLSLANEGTIFFVESMPDGYSFYSEEAEEYLTTNGRYSWNPGHSTSPSYWQLEKTTGGYYIKKDGSHYCAPDGVTAGQHVYTDKMANNANGAVFDFVLVTTEPTVGIEAPSISNDFTHMVGLDGRIVKKAKARGLYIVNGKKVLR